MAKYVYKIKRGVVDNRCRYVPCDICGKIIESNDLQHIETHTSLDLVVCWVKWEFLSNDDMERSPYHLSDLRKIVLTKTDIDPQDMRNVIVLAKWLVAHGLPQDIVTGWILSGIEE